MTDRCSAATTTRTERYRGEDEATNATQASERREPTPATQIDADARRDAWIAGSDAAKQPRSCGSSQAQIDAEVAAQRSRDKHLASEGQTKKTDAPLAPDHVGNALPGIIAGGIVAAGSAVGSVASAVGRHLLEHGTAEIVAHGGHAALGAVGKMGSASSLPTEAAPAPSSPTSTPSKPTPAPVGRTGGRAVSEPATDSLDGGQSQPRAPVGKDAIPFRPGAAPARIPEALAPEAVTIRG